MQNLDKGVLDSLHEAASSGSLTRAPPCPSPPFPHPAPADHGVVVGGKSRARFHNGHHNSMIDRGEGGVTPLLPATTSCGWRAPASGRPRAESRPRRVKPRGTVPQRQDSDETNESVQDGGGDSRGHDDRDGRVDGGRESGRRRPAGRHGQPRRAPASPRRPRTSPRAAPPRRAATPTSTTRRAVVDGNPGSYWESANNAFPQWVQVDLGSSQTVNQVVLKLPTAGWATRTADA